MSEAPETTLRDLDDKQLMLLCELIRLFVRSDGEFSGDERAAVEDIAEDAGSERFWDAMYRANEEPVTKASVLALAKEETAPDVHETLYGALYELSVADSIDAGEQDLLDELARLWNLQIRELES